MLKNKTAQPAVLHAMCCNDSHWTSRYFWAWKSFTAGWSMMQMTATPSSSLETVSLSRLVTVNILSYVSSTVSSPGSKTQEWQGSHNESSPSPSPSLFFYLSLWMDPNNSQSQMKAFEKWSITSRQILHSFKVAATFPCPRARDTDCDIRAITTSYYHIRFL